MTVPPQQPPPGWQPPQPPPSGWQQPGQPSPSGWQRPGQPPAYPQQPYPQQPGPAHYPQQPAYPPPPYQAPAPPPVTKRIPEDLPFVVFPSLRKRMIFFGLVLLVIVLIFACPLGFAMSSSGDVAPFLAILGCVVVSFGLLIGIQLYLISSGGPVLAVGPVGLWIKTRPTRGQAIWLPWEGIERVYRRRWSFEKMVCVKARDPRAGSNLGAFTALDSSMQKLFFGSGFTATANFADKPEQEIMAALAHYAAGRCPVS